MTEIKLCRDGEGVCRDYFLNKRNYFILFPYNIMKEHLSAKNISQTPRNYYLESVWRMKVINAHTKLTIRSWTIPQGTVLSKTSTQSGRYRFTFNVSGTTSRKNPYIIFCIVRDDEVLHELGCGVFSGAIQRKC